MRYLLGLLFGLFVTGAVIARRERIYLQSPVEGDWQDLVKILKRRRLSHA